MEKKKNTSKGTLCDIGVRKSNNNTSKSKICDIGIRRKSNNNKSFGLGKERELKKKLESECMFVSRSRGSFGTFDIQAFDNLTLRLISVKSTKQKYWSMKPEIKKIRECPVPSYCTKELWIWWSPRKDRDKKGWEVIKIP